MSVYTIQDTTMTGIADAVRKMRHEKTQMTPEAIQQKIAATRLGIPIEVSCHIDSETGKWVRPEGWPDLDVLTATTNEGDDCLYLTYDLTKTEGYGWIGVYVQNATNNTPFWVERGHIENGAFVVDESHEQSSTSAASISSTRYFMQTLDATYGDIQLWRVRSNSHIVRWGFGTNSRTTAEQFPIMLQPCVEMGGRLSHLTTFYSSSASNTAAGTNPKESTFWLERCGIVLSGAVTNLDRAWDFAYNLQEINTSGWNTANWAVTSMVAAWAQCYSLQSLDLSGWNTANWAVTNMSNCWSSCYSLRDLDLGGWDTTNWAVTNMSSCWSDCYSLQSINMSEWNTENWAITDFSYVWSNCYSLQNLDINHWDTSNWEVTTLRNTWWNCHALQSLDLSGWNTSNWSVTSLSTTWSNCYSLQSLDISTWDTSNWAVTTLGNCWSNCYSLQSLDISTWDTSNWEVTSITYMLMNCFSLQTIDLSSFGGRAWALGSPSSIFNNNTLIAQKSIIGLETWDTSRWTGVATGLVDGVFLEDFNGLNAPYNQRYSGAVRLTHDSLVNILTTLPTVTAARTVTLGTHNINKLTSDEIAIATAKGWTVA